MHSLLYPINRNMRCIEMMLCRFLRLRSCRLIETWDVLKFIFHSCQIRHCRRLIETWDVLKWCSNAAAIPVRLWLIETWDVLKCFRRAWQRSFTTINRNMRCIEILWSSTEEWWRLINRNMRCIEISAFRLHQAQLWQINRNMRCIEMNWENPETSNRMINRNMRCIEILKPLLAAPLLMRLIETWDVLKST